MTSPNMAKVLNAVAVYGVKRTPSRDGNSKPMAAPPQDAAIRKPLTSHGRPCRSGFNHPDFLNWT